jgi:hypothetical protein
MVVVETLLEHFGLHMVQDESCEVPAVLGRSRREAYVARVNARDRRAFPHDRTPAQQRKLDSLVQEKTPELVTADVGQRGLSVYCRYKCSVLEA